MFRLARTLLLVLVAAWLPVTLHCRLEAAGFFTAADDCCTTEQAAGPAGDCKDDACPTVENALYKESNQVLAVASPDLGACLVWFEPTAPCASVSALSPARHAPPPDLRVTWQFVTRAAPPARAPSLNHNRA